MKFPFLTLFACLATVAFCTSSYGQAYCALRDPISTIQDLAPDSSGHRSITELVGGTARSQVAEALPFTIHFNELGKHTLYVILKDGVPDGLLHARSEKGKWGLVEIVWYLDLDLTVRDFRFQRCRDRNQDEIESDSFVTQIRGKNFAQIREMLDTEGSSLNPSKLSVSADATPLALSSVQSALKTIAVTEIVWRKHLINLRAAALQAPQIREGLGISAQPPQMTSVFIAEPYTSGVMDLLDAIEQRDEWIIDRRSVEASKSVTAEGVARSLSVRTRCTAHEHIVTLTWTVDSAGRIVSVTPDTAWPSDDVREAFTGLEGLSLDQIHECSTAGQVAAAEVLAISKIHLGT